MQKKGFEFQEKTEESMTSKQRSLLLISVIVVSFNLRPAITSVGPLLGTIRDQLGLSNWSAGIITTLPLATFSITSLLAPKTGNRLGYIHAIFLGLLLLLIGIGVRSIPLISTVYLGMALVGIGIAIINVLLPAVIKERFPNKIGRMTSIYSTMMVLFAAIASGLSVPIAKGIGIGWELSLLSWSVLAVMGMIMLIFNLSLDKHSVVKTIKYNENKKRTTLWKSSLAWQVSLFMGLQSYCFFVLVSWLPEILNSYGFSIATAGWLLSYSQFIGLIGTFLVPILAEKLSNQQGIAIGIGSCFSLGIIGILIGGPKILLILSVTFVGLAAGGAVSLSYIFFGMRVRNAHQAGELSGMAQFIGYVFAATGPLLVGILYDISHSWTLPLVTILIVIVFMTVVGVGAGKNEYVD